MSEIAMKTIGQQAFYDVIVNTQRKLKEGQV